MKSAELLGLSATELSGLIHARKVAPSEVMAAHLAQVEAVNGAVNARNMAPRRDLFRGLPSKEWLRVVHGSDLQAPCAASARTFAKALHIKPGAGGMPVCTRALPEHAGAPGSWPWPERGVQQDGTMPTVPAIVYYR